MMTTAEHGGAAVASRPAVGQVQQYRRDGWTKIEGLLDEDGLARARAALDGAMERDANGTDRGPAYRDDPTYRRVLVNLRRLPEETREIDLGWNPKIAAVARDLLGVEHVQLWQEGALVKPPKDEGSKPTNWHQDFTLQPFDRREALTVWIALDDLPVDRGTMTFLPGSHRLGPLGRVNFATDEMSIDDLRNGVNGVEGELLGDIANPSMKAGDATAHGTLTLHSAGPNLTDVPRRAWAISYVSTQTRYTGAPSGSFDGLGLTLHETFNPELFPVIV